MSRRITKQFIYGFLYLVVLAALVFGFYRLFLRPTPSCTNGIQDQNETGIDCGGVCGNVCLSAANPLEVPEKALVFHPAASHTVLLGEVRNPNADIAALNFGYHFDLYDASGTLVGTVQGDSYLYGSEIRYLAAFDDAPVAAAATRAELVLEVPEWIAATQFPRPPLDIQDSRVATTTGMFSVTGHAVNRDTLALPHVTVLALFHGRFGEIAGVSQTELDNVAAGEARAFTIVHPALPGVADTKLTLYVTARRP
jgi:hypothetical protein